MGEVCEHEFQRADPKNKNYSLIEYDLHAKLDLTISKNIKENRYEIATISKPRVVKYRSKDLQEIVRTANELEGDVNTVVRCGVNCRKRMKQ